MLWLEIHSWLLLNTHLITTGCHCIVAGVPSKLVKPQYTSMKTTLSVGLALAIFSLWLPLQL